MAFDPMASLRRLNLEGPDFRKDDPLWAADIDAAGALKGQDPGTLNYALRVLVQEAEPVQAFIENRKRRFHEPLLLAGAATPRDLVEDGPRRVRILGKALKAAELSDTDAPLYEDIRVAPAELWPRRNPPSKDEPVPVERRWHLDPETGKYEIATPRLRVTEGRIRIGYKLGQAGSFETALGIAPPTTAGTPATIFGCLEIIPVKLKGATKTNGLIFDLTPQGVEMDLQIPDPFARAAGGIDTAVRVRLAADGGRARLELIGGSDALRLAASLAALGQELSRGSGPLSLMFAEGRVPPLAWPLEDNPYVCGVKGETPLTTLPPGAAIARLLTPPVQPGAAVSVAEVVRPAVSLPKRAGGSLRQVNVTALGTSPAKNGPTVTLTWKDDRAAPQSADIGALSGAVDTDVIRDRLETAWRASGTLGASEPADYAFLALARGQAQTPLPTRGAPAAVEAAGTSAINGLLHTELDRAWPDARGAPPLARASLDLVAAGGLTIVATHDIAWTITATLSATSGSLDGALWIAEASPTPVEILPAMDAGPAALGSAPIQFGGGAPKAGWLVDVDPFNLKGLTKLTLVLDTTCPLSRPLIPWRPDRDQALVSAHAMTRTAESALRPSATRELFPSEVFADKAGNRTIVLTYDRGPLPIDLECESRIDGQGLWRWPWPAETSPDELGASPKEIAGVSMVSLTLPGVEFTPAGDAKTATSTLRASLRFDLPQLDELHANTKAPKPKAPAGPERPGEEPPSPMPEAPPTALDLARLSAAWDETARRSARARTAADRVVLAGEDDGPVTLWHAFDDQIVDGKVLGLIQTYTWSPPLFHVAPSAPNGDGLALGAYTLGAKPATIWFSGPTALGGFSGAFKADGAANVLEPGNKIKVDGFAADSFQPKAGWLHDNRGLLLATDAVTLGPADDPVATTRALTNRTLPDTERDARLLTLSEPLALLMGRTPMRFWCRDLPLRKKDDLLVFDGRGKLETASGPDPAALGPERLSHTLYEWRFYEDGLRKPAFEAALLDPLAVRPLRLLEASFGADGTLRSLQVLASVQTKIAADDEETAFGEDRAYASGNLITLTFDASMKLKTDGIARVALDAGVLKPTTRPLAFVRPARAVVQGDKAPGAATTATVSLKLTARADGSVSVSDAKLKTRLFGSDVELSRDSTGGSAARHMAFTGAAASPTLDIPRVTLDWSQPDLLRLELPGGKLTLPLSNAVKAVVRPLNGSELSWLNLRTTVLREVIDHETGAVTLEIDAPVTDGASLFRGFWLPDGRLRGAIAIAFGPPANPGEWPIAGAVHAELAFDASRADGSKRVTALRYRHAVQAGGEADAGLWLDAAFGGYAESAIHWPAGRLDLDDAPFTSLPADKPSWTRTLAWKEAGLELRHNARPRMLAHRFPLMALTQDQEVVRLGAPWRFRTVTDHSLSPVSGTDWDGAKTKDPQTALRWTAVDEVTLWDMRAPRTDDGYAFVPQYKSGPVSDMPIAGLMRRVISGAGLPNDAMVTQIGRGAEKADEALVLSGACVVDIGLGADEGVTLVLPWVVPWSAAADDAIAGALGPIAAMPQMRKDATYQAAAYDAAAGTPRRLAGPPALSLSAQDGTESLLVASLTAFLGDWPAPRMAADQAVLTPRAAEVDEPMFLRALVVLKALAARRKTLSPGAVTSIVPGLNRAGAPRELRLAVSVWPLDTAIGDEAADPEVTLIALDAARVAFEALPGPIASGLSETAGTGIEADGRARAEAGQRAFGLLAAPRIVLLARVDPTYTRLQLAAGETPPHVRWIRTELPPALLPRPAAHPLQPEADTVFASPALGWPSGDAVSGLSGAQPQLGAEVVRRNTDLAWAGRARSLGWPAVAGPGRSGADRFREAAFISMGQRTAFRRVAAEGFRAPPDRLSVLASPRARAPTVEALSAAFEPITKAALSTISPGQLEVTVTGQRPGALFVQHEGLVSTGTADRMDPDLDQFGRPAARGPIIPRQLRAPRSAALDLRQPDLGVRRATFVALDEVDAGADALLKAFKVLRGQGAVVRSYAGGSIAALTLSVAQPFEGWLTRDWTGSISLAASVPKGKVDEVLISLGLLDAGASGVGPRAELRVGDTVVAFSGPALEAGDDQHATLRLELPPETRAAALERIRAALDAANADTAVRLTLQGRDVGDGAAPPDADGDGRPDVDLLAGPPRVIVLELSHVPTRRRWLPRRTFTLAFGDPAYDRELGSPARNVVARLKDVPYVFAVDRADYDLGSTLHFAAWRQDDLEDHLWRLRVELTPRDGGDQRRLRIPDHSGELVEAARFRSESGHALAVSALREADGTAAKLRAGDRLRLFVRRDGDPDGLPALDVGLVDEPVFAPPAAIYGLVTRVGETNSVAASLFATAPLPQVVEFPDLLGDLKAGHVRRRALFLWNFGAAGEPGPDGPLCALVKIDRTGGGQLPRDKRDFRGPS